MNENSYLSLSPVAWLIPIDCECRYKRLVIEKIALRVRKVVWCPFGCETSQVHNIGERQPIVQCHSCGRHFCYIHKVEWHREHTCEEYDMHQRDHTFRSKLQLENDAREALNRHISDTRLRIQRAEEECKLRCLRESQAAEARRIEKARIAREAREAAERAAREEARRRREEEERRVAQLNAAEIQGRQTVYANSTKCPWCGHFVQRIDGW